MNDPSPSSRPFAQGSTTGALVRIAGALGVLLLVLAVTVALGAVGWSSSSVVLATTFLAVIAYCVRTWVTRHEVALAPLAVQQLDELAQLVERERVTPAEDRASGASNRSLFDTADMIDESRKRLGWGDEAGAASVFTRIADRAREEWTPRSLLAERAQSLGTLGQGPRGKRLRWRGPARPTD